MSGKIKNMSLAMDKDMQEFLKRKAREANNVSVSKLVRDLIETYLLEDRKITIINHDPDFVPIVLKVPSILKGDRDGVQTWLKARMPAIVEKFANAKF